MYKKSFDITIFIRWIIMQLLWDEELLQVSEIHLHYAWNVKMKNTKQVMSGRTLRKLNISREEQFNNFYYFYN